MHIPCVIARGGTSKGIFLNEADLPIDEQERTRFICSLFGSPDFRQVNGLGGGDPLTSKVGILSSRADGREIGYRSGEVRLGKSAVNYGIMCGNLAAAVGQAAYCLKLISEPQDNRVEIFNLNSNIPIVASYTDFSSAICGQEVDVKLTFNSPGGAVTGRLLPADEPTTALDLRKRSIKCSIVEAGALYTFVFAETFGLTARETPSMLDSMSEFREEIEEIRAAVADKLNTVHPSLNISAGQIKVAIVGPPDNTDPFAGEIVARIINPAATHKAYAVSGAISTCTAAALAGTLVNRLVSKSLEAASLSILHPDGLLDVLVRFDPSSDVPSLISADILRSSRLLMNGVAYVGDPAF